jgi:hypothetical protein
LRIISKAPLCPLISARISTGASGYGDQQILFAINELSHGRQTIALTWKKVERFSSGEDPCG